MEHLKVASFGYALALIANIRLDCNTNTLACVLGALVMRKKVYFFVE